MLRATINTSQLYNDENIIDFFLGFTAVFLLAVTAAVCCYIRPKEMTLLDAIERLVLKLDRLLPKEKQVLPTTHERQAVAPSPLEAITVDAKPHIQTTFVVPALYIGTPPTTPPITPSSALSPGLSAAGLKRRQSSSVLLQYPSIPTVSVKPGPENV
jgi:hypothetical protein